jgi:hypothetical protein
MLYVWWVLPFSDETYWQEAKTWPASFPGSKGASRLECEAKIEDSEKGKLCNTCKRKQADTAWDSQPYGTDL